jgi:hypothetical protein
MTWLKESVLRRTSSPGLAGFTVNKAHVLFGEEFRSIRRITLGCTHNGATRWPVRGASNEVRTVALALRRRSEYNPAAQEHQQRQRLLVDAARGSFSVRNPARQIKHENFLGCSRLLLLCLSNRLRDRIRKRSPAHPIRHRCKIHYSISCHFPRRRCRERGHRYFPQVSSYVFAPFTGNEKNVAIIAPQHVRK